MPISTRHKSNVKSGTQVRVEWTGKDGKRMDVGMAVMTAVVVIVPFFALALASLRFGVDSRPGIGDRDDRPWLVG
jgi:hypothetical protein